MKPKPSKLFLLILLLSGYISHAQWNKRTIGSYDLNCVRYVNATTLFVGGTSGLYKSTNSGSTFSPVAIPALLSINDICVIDSLTLIAVGSFLVSEEQIIKSTDGGASWNIVYTDNTGGLPIELNSVHFPSRLTGYVTGTNGHILKTFDGGNNWIPLSVPTSQELQGVYFTDPVTGFVISDTTIWKTVNGGLSWSPKHIGEALTAITFTNSLTGFVVGNDIILKTTNQGNTWTPKPFSGKNLGAGTDYMTGIKMINNDSGFVCSDGGIYKTANQGESFQRIPGTTVSFNTAIDFGSSMNGFVTSYAGNASQTTKGGGNVPQNDAMMYDLILPSPNNCNGTHPVSVKIANLGMLPLTSVTIRWKVNNVLQPAVQWTGNLTFDNSTGPILLGNYTFTRGTHTVSVWTENPNGVPDNNRSGDTLQSSINFKRLGGAYTIGGTSPDFNTIENAVNALSVGMCDNVIFNIRNGTYPISPVTFTKITDSLWNGKQVLFQPESGDSSKVIITGTAAGGFVNLNGARNIAFSKLTFINTTYPTVFSGTNSAKNISFYKCQITGKVPGVINYRGLIEFKDKSSFDSIFIVNCRLTGGEQAIALSSKALTEIQNYPEYTGCFISILNCKLDSQLLNSINIWGSHTGSIERNQIRRMEPTPAGLSANNGTGIYTSVNKLPLTIAYNDIQSVDGVGIILKESPISPLYRSRIYNNFIRIGNTKIFPASSVYGSGIGISKTTNTDIVHNTVIIDVNANGRALSLSGPNSNCDIINNIFSVNGTDAAVYTIEQKSVRKMAGNAIYASNGIVYSDGTTISRIETLTRWQTYINSDQYTVMASPEWRTSDFHFQPNKANYGIADKGIPYPEITVDMDGDLRSTTHPDPGADEFNIPQKDIALLADTGIQFVAAGVAPVNIDAMNFGRDTLYAFEIQWKLNGVQQNPVIWSGIFAPGVLLKGINLGLLNRASGSMDTITAHITSSNGSSETITINDSCYLIRKAGGLSGTYTIGGINPDYISFNAAKNDLVLKGICGPVIFNVRPGMYAEQLVLPNITGSNSSNTILFQSQNGDSSTTRLRFNAPQSADNVLIFDGASYIQFYKIGVEHLRNDSFHYNVISFINTCHHITLSNMLIQGALQGPDQNSTLIGNDSYRPIHHITIQNCWFVGGANGIWSSSLLQKFSKEIVIKHNVFTNQSNKVIMLDFQENLEIAYNKFVSPYIRNTPLVEIVKHDGPLKVHHNYLLNPVENGLGLILRYCNTAYFNKNLVYNNFISGSFITMSSNLQLTHNTLLSPPQSNTLWLHQSEGISLTNNILYGNNPGYEILSVYDPSKSLYSDNNCFYQANSKGLLVGYGPIYKNLKEWQETGFDQYSFSKKPELISLTDPHLIPNHSGILTALGQPTEISDDIDGEPRNKNKPGIGADETMLQPLTNDAGIFDIENPSIVCSAPSPVRARIRNYGTDTLKSVTVSMTTGGNTQAISLFNLNIPPLGISPFLEVGTYIFNSQTLYTLSLKTFNPNGASDLRTSNDTFTSDPLHAPLSGTYTIGADSGTNYTTINSALNDLINYGVCGPVVFNIHNGIYNENVTIPSINGGSQTNTITFKSENNDSSLVTLYNYMGPNDYTLGLDSANYIIFKHLGFRSFRPLNVSIFHHSQNIRFSNCLFREEVQSTNSPQNLQFIECRFLGPLNLYGGTKEFGKGILVTRNIFNSTKSLTITYFDSSVVVSHNSFIYDAIDIHKASGGIYMLSCSNFYITHNHIHGGYDYGVQIIGGVTKQPHTSLIGNNFVSGSVCGISLNSTSNLNVSNNNIHIYPNSGNGNIVNTCLLLTNDNFNTISILNNILSITDSSKSCMFLSGNPTSFQGVKSDYNIFANSSSRIFQTGVSYYTTASVYTAFGNEQHSIIGDPQFINDSNLHILSAIGRGQGVPVTDVIDDIDGQPRNAYTPDIGADEGILMPVVNLGNDTIICSNLSTYLLSNKYLIRGMQYQWSTGDTTAQISIQQSGTYWLKGTNENGSVTDTISIQLLSAPLIYAGSDTILCKNQSLILDAGISGKRYLWSTGDTTQTSVAGSTGNYWVHVIHANGCISYDTLHLTINPGPVVNIGADTAICPGATLTLNAATVSASYLWSTGDSSKSLTVTAADTYILTQTDSMGCFNSDTLEVIFKTLPVSSFTIDSSSLPVYQFYNKSTNHSGSIWLFGDGESSTDNHTGHQYTQSGLYTITLTAFNGCGSDSSSQSFYYYQSHLGIGSAQNSKQSIRIFPNPASGYVEVYTDLPETSNNNIVITDIVGKKLEPPYQTFDRGFRLDVSGIPDGIYFMILKYMDKQVITKFEVLH